MRVHQMGSVLCYGDAITNEILAIDGHLTGWGFETRIYGANIEASPTAKAQSDAAYAPYLDNRDDVLLYHYSAYCDNYELFRRSRNRKVLIYHNITPAHFFRPYDPLSETISQRGRAMLPLLRDCDLALGVSEYNRQELVEEGFAPERTGVLPLVVSLDNFSGQHRTEGLYQRLTADGTTNLLFVGRMAPNKAVEDVITVFAAYHGAVNPRSRLTLVGARFLPRYDAVLDRLVGRLGLAGVVRFTDRASLGDLKAYYEAADVFVCASRHEGFCVPLLEAMTFDVPILARAAAAVPDTLGGAGVLFHAVEHAALAETVGLLARDGGLRGQVAAGQRRRLADFTPAHDAARLRALLARIGVDVPDDANMPRPVPTAVEAGR